MKSWGWLLTFSFTFDALATTWRSVIWWNRAQKVTIYNVESPGLIRGLWNGLSVSVMIGPICTELDWDVKQTRYHVCDVWVYRATNSADAVEVGYPTVGSQENDGKRTLFHCCFGDCRMLVYKFCDVCIIWRKPIAACKIQCQSPSRRLSEPVYDAAFSPRHVE